MGDDGFEYRAFRRTSWGPVHVVVRRDVIEATVGGATVSLDMTDRRPALERQQNPFRDVFDDDVPVLLGGRQVAAVTNAPGPGGLVRRRRRTVTGDPEFVLPGMALTGRAMPQLLTLTCDAGVLVSSRRWAAPLNMAVTEWSFVREHDLVPPRVARDTRPEHLAFWMVVKESMRS